MNAQYGADTFEDNRTQIIAHGFALAEVPVSYGHPLSEHLAVGGSLKLLVGRVYASEISVFDEDVEDALTEVRDDSEQTVAVGLDLGVLARISQFQVGLTGRNLTAPSFDAPDTVVADLDVDLDPQVTFGVAWIPFETLTVEVDIDLLAVDTLLPGWEAQRLAIGAEWEPWHVLALRAGISDNIAESSDDALVHGGLGVNIKGVRLDLAGAASLGTVEVDGSDIPSELRVAFGLAADY